VGVGKVADAKAKAAGARPRLRARPRTPQALSGDSDGPGAIPEAIPATGEGLRLREDGEGEGPGSCTEYMAGRLGRESPLPLHGAKGPLEDGHSEGVATLGLGPTSPRLSKAISGGGRSTGGVPAIHAIPRERDPTVLPGATRRSRRLGRRGLMPYCPICGSSTDLTVDHIIPRSLGGPDTPRNLRTLCRRCNSTRGGRLVSDSALSWQYAFRRLALAMGLGALEPPALGMAGPEPVLDRLLAHTLARARVERGGQ
jgi:hypothetical protein